MKSDSRKQQDPPRYQGRDAAAMLATFMGPKCCWGRPLLRSRPGGPWARPAVHALLKERFGGTRCRPSSWVICKAHKQRRMEGHQLTLLEAIETLEAGRQVILPRTARLRSVHQCRTCGWVPERAR